MQERANKQLEDALKHMKDTNSKHKEDNSILLAKYDRLKKTHQ